MKAKQVLEILGITRQTLVRYVKDKKIMVNVMGNGRYNYDDDSVYSFLNKNVARRTVIYARVSTPKQKKDLINQVEMLKQFCFNNGKVVSAIHEDVASGISFEKRKAFFIMLDEIIAGKIKEVIISYKDRLSRVGFELFKHLFESCGCKIVVMSEVGSTKLDSAEIFEEIVSLLHCYSMKLYSSRKRKIIEKVIEPERIE